MLVGNKQMKNWKIKKFDQDRHTIQPETKLKSKESKQNIETHQSSNIDEKHNKIEIKTM